MDGVFGLIANVISTALTHPIDVIKTNFQLAQTRNVLENSKNSNVKNIVRDVYQTRGFRGFLTGITPNLFTYPVFWAFYFASDQIIRGKDNRKIVENNFLDEFVKSYSAGLLGSCLTNPLFVLKIRMQDSNRGNTTSLFKMIKQTNALGYQIYFKGLGSTYLNNLKLAIQFPLYKILKDKTDSVVLSSFIAKVASSSFAYPFDLIRVHQRNSDSNLSTFKVGRELFNKNGFLGMYRGVFLYNAVSVPNFVIMMVCLESLKKFYYQK